MRNYWLKPACQEIDAIRLRFATAESATRKIIFVAFLAVFSAIFQSMGGLLPGAGYLVSPLATAPIVLGAVLSFGTGLSAYLLTILLLLWIQPSELFVFPFATGWLALGIGSSFLYFRSRLSALLMGSIVLWAGILLLLYVIRFPVLGPGVTSTFHLNTVGIILVFSIFYSWLWVEISRWLIQKLGKVLS